MEDINKLIEDNIKLVHYMYTRLQKSSFVIKNKDDLISEGMIGLANAAKTYNADKTKFSTYAARCIQNEMLQYIRREKKHCGIVSLDAEFELGHDGDTVPIGETIEDLSDDNEQIYTKSEIETALKILDQREIEIVRLIADGVKQIEIGRTLGLSQSYISRLLSDIHKKCLAVIQN